MDLEQAVLGRRSIRVFKPDPVPAATLARILDHARWTPSFANTQPWEFIIVSGQPLEELRQQLKKAAVADPDGRPDIPWPTFPEPFSTRRREVGLAINGALDIRAEEKERREAWRLTGMAFFNAPHVIVISIDKCFTAWGILDVGAVSQTIMLLAHAQGLGTCPQAAPTRYPRLFRNVLGIPESKLIVLAVPIGYPDKDSPVNTFQRPRAPLAELLTWKGGGP
jgi:nitroreductase